MNSKKTGTVVWSGMPTSEAELKQIKAAIESTYDSFVAIETARSDIKDIFDDINARTGIPKRVFNFLAKANYKGNAYETIQNNTELEEAFEALNKVTL